MARQRTHEDAARTKMVSVRLRPERYDALTAEAEKLGITRAAYVEHLIENKVVTLDVLHPDGLPVPLINELKRIGNNLNQLAHAANAAKMPSEAALTASWNEIISVMISDEQLARRYERATQASSRHAEPLSPPAPGISTDEACQKATEIIKKAEADAAAYLEKAYAEGMDIIDAAVRRSNEIRAAARKEIENDPKQVVIAGLWKSANSALTDANRVKAHAEAEANEILGRARRQAAESAAEKTRLASAQAAQIRRQAENYAIAVRAEADNVARHASAMMLEAQARLEAIPDDPASSSPWQRLQRCLHLRPSRRREG